MKEQVLIYAAICLVSLAGCYGLEAIGSTYLYDLLLAELVTIICTFLAVNIASYGILLSKASDLEMRFNRSAFQSTRDKVRFSLYEQLAQIIVAVVVVSVITVNFDRAGDDTQHGASRWLLVSLIQRSMLVSVFLWALDTTRDTALAVVHLFNEIAKQLPKENGN